MTLKTASYILDKYRYLCRDIDGFVLEEEAALKAMKEYAEQYLELAADQVIQFDTLVDTYDCIYERNQDVANKILNLKQQIKINI